MSTVLQTKPERNRKLTPTELVRQIEEDYTGYPASGILSEINRLKEKVERLDPADPALKHTLAEIEDFECVHSMAESYESLLRIARQSFLNQQLKEDYDFTSQQVIDALPGHYISASHVEIDVMGDVLPVSVCHDGLRLTLQSVANGVATYSVQSK